MTDGLLFSVLGKGILIDSLPRSAALTQKPAGAPSPVDTSSRTVLAHVSTTAADGSVRTRTTYSDGSFETSATAGDTVQLGRH